MSRSLTAEWSFTADELAVLTARVLGPGPVAILGLRPCHPTADRRDSALHDAARSLERRDVIVDGVVDAEVVALLHTLQRPDRELVMRLVTPTGIGRFTVARRGSASAVARRVGGRLQVRALGADLGLNDASSTLLGELPAAVAATIDPVGAPLSDMAGALSESHDGLVLADRIRALGAPQRAAGLLGTALGSRQAFAEVVYSALVEHDGLVERVPAAVAVMYTARGRVIAVPSASPSGELWSTLKPGTDHVFGQAVGQLVELSTQRWEDGN